MSKHATIQYQDDSLVVTGELNFRTAVSLWQESLPLIKQYPDLHFDFSAVKSSNSAGLALILEWIKYAKLAKKSIRFSHIPTQLHSIIAVAGLKQMLSSFSDNPAN
ncbi:MAG: STAS domain-containing protein [Gammaproteobacteria bacterium]|nr:STAS domain-containing protein [Gammaproteobacteria bacterium]